MTPESTLTQNSNFGDLLLPVSCIRDYAWSFFLTHKFLLKFFINTRDVYNYLKINLCKTINFQIPSQTHLVSKYI